MNAERSTILITGATDGLGFAVARVLAEQGAHLILHGRNAEKLELVTKTLRSEIPNSSVETELADFESLRQVDQMATRILEKHQGLQVLVNNAGIGAGFANRQRAVTSDGLEARFAVNYLAGYHLTKRLLPLLKTAAPARMVNIASLAQHPIDFANLQLEQEFDSLRAYGQSKLAQIMHAFDLAAELEHSGVTVNALHPSSLMPTNMVLEGWTRTIDTLEAGATATVRLATGADVAGITGQFFNKLVIGEPDHQAFDLSVRTQLREVSDRLIAAALVQ
jgi:NAD(P)-dependent dehydrogenase (short-subunit alcohol dehydrogenase family)